MFGSAGLKGWSAVRSGGSSDSGWLSIQVHSRISVSIFAVVRWAARREPLCCWSRAVRASFSI
jgi:hypothetical protein